MTQPLPNFIQEDPTCVICGGTKSKRTTKFVETFLPQGQSFYVCDIDLGQAQGNYDTQLETEIPSYNRITGFRRP